jgi:F-type H+-transporting ATPase subunit epsilon
MGVLTNHIPLLTGLDIGVVLIRDQISLQWKPVIVTGGFALVNNNNITILVNEAELGLQLNYQEVESSFLETKLAFDTVSDPKKKIEINSKFKKARARFQVAQQFQS